FVNVPRVANRPVLLANRVLNCVNQVAIEYIIDAPTKGALARDAEDLLQRTVPGRNAPVEIDYKNADINALDYVLGELLEPGKLIGLFHLGSVQQTVVDRHRNVARQRS